MTGRQLICRNKVYIYQESSPVQGIHWHDDFEIILVLSGTLDLQVSFEKFMVQENQLMIINSGESHRLQSAYPETEVLFITLDMDNCFTLFPNLYESIAIADYSEGYLCLNTSKNLIMNDISNIVKYLSSFKDMNQVDGEILNQKIAVLLNNVIVAYMPKIKPASLKSSELKKQEYDKDKIEMVYRMIKYLYENYNRKVSLKELADQEYLSLYHMSHSIKEITGTCFRDWLNYIRVEQSEKLLLTTNKPVSAVSDECGFSDVRYYNKHFKKWYGISPFRFRKLFKSSYNASLKTFDLDENEYAGFLDSFHKPERETIKEQRIDPLNVIRVNLAERRVLDTFDRLRPLFFYVDFEQLLDFKYHDYVTIVQKEIGFQEIYIDVSLSGEEVFQSMETAETYRLLISYFSDIGLKTVFSLEDKKDISGMLSNMRKLLEHMRRLNKGKVPYCVLQLPYDCQGQKDVPAMESLEREFSMFIEGNAPCIRIMRGTKTDQEVEDVNLPEASITMRRVIGSSIAIDSLIGYNGVKSHLYYLYLLLSYMEDAIIIEGERYIVTRKGKNLQFLLYNNDFVLVPNGGMKFDLQLENMPGTYKIVYYKWNLDTADDIQIVRNPQVLEYISDEERDLLNMMSYPYVFFDLKTLDYSHTFSAVLECNSIQLILFTEIEERPQKSRSD